MVKLTNVSKSGSIRLLHIRSYVENIFDIVSTTHQMQGTIKKIKILFRLCNSGQ